MKIYHYRDKLLQLDQMIRLQVKGTTKELCHQLEMEEASFFRLLDVLRNFADEQGAEIIYNRNRACYYYTKKIKLQFQYVEC
jgi:hypothetical protein